MITEKRSYIIPLRKTWLNVPRHKRTARSIRAIKSYIQRHAKADDIKLGRYLNLFMWSRGKRTPPHKVHVEATPLERVHKNKKYSYVKVELVGAPEEPVVEEAKKPEAKKAEDTLDKKVEEQKEIRKEEKSNKDAAKKTEKKK